MIDYSRLKSSSFTWKDNDLYVIGRRKSVVSIVRDDKYPAMCRVRQPDGTLSDMVNRTRAKDAALAIARVLLTPETARGASPVR